jgi:hypothetical protein
MLLRSSLRFDLRSARRMSKRYREDHADRAWVRARTRTRSRAWVRARTRTRSRTRTRAWTRTRRFGLRSRNGLAGYVGRERAARPAPVLRVYRAPRRFVPNCQQRGLRSRWSTSTIPPANPTPSPSTRPIPWPASASAFTCPGTPLPRRKLARAPLARRRGRGPPGAGPMEATRHRRVAGRRAALVRRRRGTRRHHGPPRRRRTGGGGCHRQYHLQPPRPGCHLLPAVGAAAEDRRHRARLSVRPLRPRRPDPAPRRRPRHRPGPGSLSERTDDRRSGHRGGADG